LFADMLNITGKLEIAPILNDAKRLQYLQGTLTDLNKFMKKYYGDYSSEVSKKPLFREFHAVFITGPWIRHATNLLRSVPDHPLKMGIGSALARIAASKLQPSDEPKKMRNQGFLPVPGQTDQNGKQEYFKGWDTDVTRSGLGILGDALGMLFPTGEPFEVPSRISAPIATPIEGYLSKDMNSKKDFLDENPAVERHFGRYRNRETKQIISDRGLGKYKFPGPIRLLENTFPNQVHPLQTLSTMKDGQLYVKTPFSQPGRSARMRTKSGPIKQSWVEFWLNQLGLQARGG
jgi:hypothetical protein